MSVRVLISILATVVISISASANGGIDDYRHLIEIKAEKYGISPAILSSIVIKESSGKPWTFNVDGEGMYFPSKKSAIRGFKALLSYRWLLKYKIADKQYERRFFKHEHQALNWISKENRRSTSNSIPMLTLKAGKRVKLEKVGDVVVRRLSLVNTDIGLSQISYRWHGKALKDSVNFTDWLDPAFNLDYAAKHIKELINRYNGDVIVAIAHYHSSNETLQSAYLAKFMPTFRKESARYDPDYI